MRLGWYDSIAYLYPYLTVLFVLLSFLCGFGVHTFLTHRRALKAPRPRPLSLALEAGHAALAANADHPEVAASPWPDDIVSGPDLLARLNDQDRTALVEVRRLRVAMVEVKSGGRYRIVDGTGGNPKALDRQAG